MCCGVEGFASSCHYGVVIIAQQGGIFLGLDGSERTAYVASIESDSSTAGTTKSKETDVKITASVQLLNIFPFVYNNCFILVRQLVTHVYNKGSQSVWTTISTGINSC